MVHPIVSWFTHQKGWFWLPEGTQSKWWASVLNWEYHFLGQYLKHLTTCSYLLVLTNYTIKCVHTCFWRQVDLQHQNHRPIQLAFGVGVELGSRDVEDYYSDSTSKPRGIQGAICGAKKKSGHPEKISVSNGSTKVEGDIRYEQLTQLGCLRSMGYYHVLSFPQKKKTDCGHTRWSFLARTIQFEWYPIGCVWK